MAGKLKRDRAAERIKIQSGQNVFALDEDTRKGMRPEARRVLVLGIACACIVLAGMVAPVYMFQHASVAMTPAVFLDEVSSNIGLLVNLFAGNGSQYETRFMAVLVCALGGASLGICGSTYQGAFNNPLAAPKTLGVMGGGALGSLVWVLWLEQYKPLMPIENGSVTLHEIVEWEATLSPFQWFYLNYGQALCSVAGCFAIVGIVIGLTSLLGHGRLSNIVVIIFGQVFATGVTALISFARHYFTQGASTDTASELAQIENYTMVGTYYFRDLIVVVAPIAICIVVLLLMRRRLTLLSFGDDVANTMGVNVNRTRYAMIAVCTLLTGLAISFCGHVAFLGFISAHLARRIVGPDFRFLLPASLFVGAGFITVIEWICQSGLPLTEAYAAGPVCSILGACLFVFIVLRQRGEADGGWR